MWSKSKPYILVLPAAGLIAVLFLGGLLEGLVQSLGYFPAAGQSHFSFAGYERLLQSEDFWQSLLLTLRISLLSTVASGMIGLGIAVFLHFVELDGRWAGRIVGRLGMRLFLTPMIIPHLAAAYLVMLLFMQSGWLSRIMYALGVTKEIGQFPVLVNDPFGWGIIFTYAWKEAPFIVLMVYPVLLRIRRTWMETARVFGAGKWQIFWEIILPLLAPAWLSAVFIVFAFTFSAFEVPYVLGVTYPKMLAVYSYELYMSGGLAGRTDSLAVNVALAVITSLLGIIAYRLNRGWVTGGRGWT